MSDREKVIKGLEICEKKDCVLCPYKDEKDETYSGFCEQVLKQDALALLKEQQNQIWEFQDQVEYLTDKLKEHEKAKVVFGRTKDGEFVTECGNCGTYLDKAYSNCPKCKKELDWNSNQI